MITKPATLERLRVAVVGAGVAGLSAAHLLSRRHEVELFEKEARLGGHAHTHTVERAGRVFELDSARRVLGSSRSVGRVGAQGYFMAAT